MPRKQRRPLTLAPLDPSLSESGDNSAAIIQSDHPEQVQPEQDYPEHQQPDHEQSHHQLSSPEREPVQKRHIVGVISMEGDEGSEHQQHKKEIFISTSESCKGDISSSTHKLADSPRRHPTQSYHYHDNEDEQYEEQQLDNTSADRQHPGGKVTICRTFTAGSLQDLVHSQIPSKCTITCAVHFEHPFLSMERSYDLYLVDDKKYVLSASRSRMKLTSHFEFYHRGKGRGERLVLGGLKSNFTGLEYVVNRHSGSPEAGTEQCWIGYDINMLGLSPQRSFTVLRNRNAKLEKIPYFSQIKNYYQNGLTSRFDRFRTREASVGKNGVHELDFHGRVSSPSALNFILTDDADRECILFGKRKSDTFILEISYPFSLMEGFAIAVSNLDSKLCVR